MQDQSSKQNTKNFKSLAKNEKNNIIEEAKNIFKQVDTNGDGILDKKEYLEFVKRNKQNAFQRGLLPNADFNVKKEEENYERLSKISPNYDGISVDDFFSKQGKR